MVGRCRAERLEAFPEVTAFVTDLLLRSSRPEGLDVLCVGYGKCDLLTESCDWHAMRRLVNEFPGLVRTAHFFDPACSGDDTASARADLAAAFGSGTRARILSSDAELDRVYDFVFYFGAYEPGLFDLPGKYVSRARRAFVGVRMPGWGTSTPEQTRAARGVFMERHLDFPPESTWDPRMSEIVFDMQDRPVAFVDVFSRVTTRFEREETGDDRAFRAYLGPEEYDGLVEAAEWDADGGGPSRRPRASWRTAAVSVAAAAAVASVASVVASAR